MPNFMIINRQIKILNILKFMKIAYIIKTFSELFLYFQKNKIFGTWVSFITITRSLMPNFMIINRQIKILNILKIMKIAYINKTFSEIFLYFQENKIFGTWVSFITITRSPC